MTNVCEVKKELAVLSEAGGKPKRFTRVSWDGRGEKFDIRTWFMPEGSTELKPGKGITLSDEEMEMLVEAYDKYKLDQ